MTDKMPEKKQDALELLDKKSEIIDQLVHDIKNLKDTTGLALGLALCVVAQCILAGQRAMILELRRKDDGDTLY